MNAEREIAIFDQVEPDSIVTVSKALVRHTTARWIDNLEPNSTYREVGSLSDTDFAFLDNELQTDLAAKNLIIATSQRFTHVFNTKSGTYIQLALNSLPNWSSVQEAPALSGKIKLSLQKTDPLKGFLNASVGNQLFGVLLDFTNPDCFPTLFSSTGKIAKLYFDRYFDKLLILQSLQTTQKVA